MCFGQVIREINHKYTDLTGILYSMKYLSGQTPLISQETLSMRIIVKVVGQQFLTLVMLNILGTSLSPNFYPVNLHHSNRVVSMYYQCGKHCGS